MKRMKKSVSFLSFTISLILLLACQTAWAGKDVEIDGLIIDQTCTKIGHDFF